MPSIYNLKQHWITDPEDVKKQGQCSMEADLYTCSDKPVYKGHSMEPVNVPFMSSSPLYTG